MDSWIDELERDLGQLSRNQLLAVCGGQRRDIPSVERAERSKLASEVGFEITLWLAKRFAGTAVEFPSRQGHVSRDRANQLRAAILEAGLGDNPTRSANDIAREHNVSATWVYKLRGQLRQELDSPSSDQRQLKLPL